VIAFSRSRITALSGRCGKYRNVLGYIPIRAQAQRRQQSVSSVAELTKPLRNPGVGLFFDALRSVGAASIRSASRFFSGALSP